MWDVMAWQCISPEVIVKGFKRLCISSAKAGLMMTCCGISVKRVGMLGVSVREMKALIGTGR
jgi:hypothetical protein